jgi:hypothetical protein
MGRTVVVYLWEEAFTGMLLTIILPRALHLVVDLTSSFLRDVL